MKDIRKLRGFIFYQLLSSLLIVMICTIISSAVSYKVLHGEMSKWLIDSNNKALKQYSEIIDTLIVSNSNEIYRQVLNDISTENSMKYYLNSPLKSNMFDTLKVSKYLSSIKESNPLIQSVGIYYNSNNLLISSKNICYDLYYDFRKEELEYYSNILDISSEKRTVFTNIVNKKCLSMSRPIVTEGKVNALFLIEYSLDSLRDRLEDISPSEFNNFFVIDMENNIIFDIDPERSHGIELKSTLYNPIFNEHLGINTYNVNIEGEPSIVSFRNDGMNCWKYISVSPTSQYLKPIGYILKNLLISVAITMLAGLIFASLVLLWQSKPIHSIIALCNLANANIKTDSDGKQNHTGDTFSIIRGTLTGLMSTIETSNQELTRIMPILRDNFLNWLIIETPTDKGEIRDSMTLMQISFPFIHYCVIAIKAKPAILSASDISDIYIDEFKGEYALAEIKLQFEKTFNTNESLCYFYKKKDLIIGFVNFNYTINAFNRTCEKLTENPIYDYNIYTSSGSVVEAIEEIPDSSKLALENIEYSYIYPERRYITHDETKHIKYISSIRFQPAINSFVSYLRIADYGNCIKEFDKFINDIRTNGCNIDEFDSLMNNTFLDMRNAINIDVKLRNELEQMYSNSYNLLHFRNSLIELIRNLKITNEMLADSSATDKLIFNAKQNIKRHLFNSQLSLQFIAENLNVSSSYLSRVYSEREGMTFMDFITKMKMEHGKKLLLETDLTLDEISQKLNYASPQYFISRFKRYFNITPSVYKKKYTDSHM